MATPSYFKPESFSIEQKSNLFNGKEFCVLNGDESVSKSEAESIVQSLGGTITQNPSNFFVY